MEENWTSDIERMRWMLKEYEVSRRLDEPPGYGDGDDGDGGASVREPRRPRPNRPSSTMSLPIEVAV